VLTTARLIWLGSGGPGAAAQPGSPCSLPMHRCDRGEYSDAPSPWRIGAGSTPKTLHPLACLPHCLLAVLWMFRGRRRWLSAARRSGCSWMLRPRLTASQPTVGEKEREKGKEKEGGGR
jgi:hypothetical protein